MRLCVLSLTKRVKVEMESYNTQDMNEDVSLLIQLESS